MMAYRIIQTSRDLRIELRKFIIRCRLLWHILMDFAWFFYFEKLCHRSNISSVSIEWFVIRKLNLYCTRSWSWSWPFVLFNLCIIFWYVFFREINFTKFFVKLMQCNDWSGIWYIFFRARLVLLRPSFTLNFCPCNLSFFFKKTCTQNPCPERPR